MEDRRYEMPEDEVAFTLDIYQYPDGYLEGGGFAEYGSEQYEVEIRKGNSSYVRPDGYVSIVIQGEGDGSEEGNYEGDIGFTIEARLRRHAGGRRRRGRHALLRRAEHAGGWRAHGVHRREAVADRFPSVRRYDSVEGRESGRGNPLPLSRFLLLSPIHPRTTGYPYRRRRRPGEVSTAPPVAA